MKFYYLIFLILVLNCNKKNPIDESTKSEVQNKFSKRIWLKYGNFNDYAQIEYYIRDKDSIRNQFMYVKNNKVDTLRSQFYNLLFKKIDSNKYKGKLKFYSAFDTAKTENRVFRALEFTLAQERGDSIYWLKYKMDKNYELDFEYTGYKDGSIIGYLYETISVSLDTIRGDEGRIQLIFSTVLVDNKEKTDNPLVELLKEEQESLRSMSKL